MMQHKYKIGDRLNYTNPQGVCWGERTVTELDERSGQPCYYITPTDTPWFSVGESCLEPMPPEPEPNSEFGSW